MIKVFFIEPTNKYRRSLRRYAHWDCKDVCRHDALVFIDEIETDVMPSSGWDEAFKDNPNWPKVCDTCGMTFADKDNFQVNYDQVYKRIDTGDLMTLRDAPVGAVWDAYWLNELRWYKRTDGRVLICRTPGGDWNIDSQCSNCTRPKEEHECWVRHGKPEDGSLHVDKNGNTCAAGAGSIIIGGWHGFLHNGHLVQC